MIRQGTIRVLVTTNFDRLMERALENIRITPMVVSSPDDLAGVPPLGQGEVTLIKVHGDYLDSRIKNTPKELSEFDPAIDHLLDQVFAEYGLLVCGFGQPSGTPRWCVPWSGPVAPRTEPSGPMCDRRRATPLACWR